MTHASFFYWLAWALFAVAVLYVVGFRYLREVIASPAAAPTAPAETGTPHLFCEDGAPLDKRAAWFQLREGGTTVVGNQPRGATASTAYVYLTAHDLCPEQASIRYDRGQRGYLLEHGEGKVLHNNEPLPVGGSALLTDGDTIDLGDQTRLRFTFTAPPLPGSSASEVTR